MLTAHAGIVLFRGIGFSGSDVRVKKVSGKWQQHIVPEYSQHTKYLRVNRFTMTDQECKSCHEPLFIEIEADSDGEESKAPVVSERIPDDVQVKCGCHFHWECFLEAYNITQCPECSEDISSLSADGQQQVNCNF